MQSFLSHSIALGWLLATVVACTSMVEHREDQTQNQPYSNTLPRKEVKVQDIEVEPPQEQAPEIYSGQPAQLDATHRLVGLAGQRGGGLSRKAKGMLRPAMMPTSVRAELRRGPLSHSTHTPPAPNREGYQHHEESDFQDPREAPFSTFSTDVDTASYTNARRYLQSGSLPIPSSIRIEEFLNYFQYQPIASRDEHPVAVGTSWAPCPWNPESILLQVRVESDTTDTNDLPPLNLVYLIDTSGSMRTQLDLLVDGLSMLTRNLRAVDTVSIVTYAGSSGIALQPTSGIHRNTILAALRSLRSGGSTAGAQGIKTAYSLARQNFQTNAINRVILATDGDFNVGVSDQGSLVRLIEQERESGVFLSVLGFGRGNYQDHRLESIADHGNGQFSYIDSPLEARRVLVERAGGTLNTVAKDVKLRLEFNPAHVGEYRLIGYDNRRLTSKQFDDDKKDAGDVGAGHTVTALYEIKPRKSVRTSTPKSTRYQTERSIEHTHASEWLTTEVRYKRPQGSKSTLITHRTLAPTMDSALSKDWALLSSLAEFGLLLKGSKYKGQASFQSALTLAQSAAFGSSDPARQEYVALVARAAQLTNLQSSAGHRASNR